VLPYIERRRRTNKQNNRRTKKRKRKRKKHKTSKENVKNIHLITMRKTNIIARKLKQKILKKEQSIVMIQPSNKLSQFMVKINKKSKKSTKAKT